MEDKMTKDKKFVFSSKFKKCKQCWNYNFRRKVPNDLREIILPINLRREGRNGRWARLSAVLW